MTQRPELLQLVEELRGSEQPVVLQEQNEDVAIVRLYRRPFRARTPRGKALSESDSLWKLVGSAESASPTDATRKHEYLSESSSPR